MKTSTVLRQAILERRAVAVPGCHDAMSAKVIESCGFEAIQISGYGLAASLLAKPDVGLVQMKDVLTVARKYLVPRNRTVAFLEAKSEGAHQ